ncbi:MAG: 30S ribosomal protein S6 [Candidatus Dojkabacteria bacterium]|nr:MAG: 30S ribosomal protein S6 [Candidatus Dojkabacteria bacterium]
MQTDYELMVVLKPLLMEDIKDKIIPKISKEVKKLGGTLELKDNMGKRILAYPIKGYKEGYYLVYKLTIDSDKINELNNWLKIYDALLRHLIIREDQL